MAKLKGKATKAKKKAKLAKTKVVETDAEPKVPEPKPGADTEGDAKAKLPESKPDVPESKPEADVEGDAKAKLPGAQPDVPESQPEADAELDDMPEPKAKAKAAKARPSIANLEDNWRQYQYGELGFLCYNAGNNSVSAHCGRHGAKCRAPKVLKKAPVGYCCLWLELGEDIPRGAENADEHMSLRSPPDFSFVPWETISVMCVL